MWTKRMQSVTTYFIDENCIRSFSKAEPRSDIRFLSLSSACFRSDTRVRSRFRLFVNSFTRTFSASTAKRSVSAMFLSCSACCVFSNTAGTRGLSDSLENSLFEETAKRHERKNKIKIIINKIKQKGRGIYFGPGALVLFCSLDLQGQRCELGADEPTRRR